VWTTQWSAAADWLSKSWWDFIFFQWARWAPKKKLLRIADQKKGSLMKKFEGQSEDKSPFLARTSDMLA
jgi:hypothetical protein